jgi:hypothetical protein
VVRRGDEWRRGGIGRWNISGIAEERHAMLFNQKNPIFTQFQEQFSHTMCVSS